MEALFAALVRTTGARNEMLLEALQSLAVQSEPCAAIVIVHGSAEAFAQVRQVCAGLTLVHFVHASNEDARRKRGYPVNAGIDYCLEHLPGAAYLFLLDDDDLVYPFFTSVMAAAFRASSADLVYANTNRREAGKPLAPSYPLKHYRHLFDQNFIPSNGYAIRAEALRRSGVRVDEELEYLEDWLFLLNLLERGLRFHRIDMTLSEFRTESDAEFAYRHDLEEWKANGLRIRKYINTTSFPLPGGDLASLAQESAGAGEDQGRFADSSMTAALYRRIFELEHSFSWRSTAPLRAIAASLLRLRGRVKARA